MAPNLANLIQKLKSEELFTTKLESLFNGSETDIIDLNGMVSEIKTKNNLELHKNTVHERVKIYKCDLCECYYTYRECSWERETPYGHVKQVH